MNKPAAVIVGVGSGLSAALAGILAPEYHLVLAARNTDKLAELAAETGADVVQVQASDPATMAALFEGLNAPLEVAIYNPSARVRGPLVELDPQAVHNAIDITAYGAFLMGQAAAKCMLSQPQSGPTRGTILFTGASAGVKGFARSAPFAWVNSPSAGWRNPWPESCTHKAFTSPGSTLTAAFATPTAPSA